MFSAPWRPHVSAFCHTKATLRRVTFPRLQTQIDRRLPRRLVHPVLPVDPAQQLQAQGDGVERAAAVAVEAAAVRRVGEAAAEEPGFEERLAQAVEQVVDKREGVVGLRALLLDL